MKKILPILLALAAVAAGCTGRQERSRNADKYDEWKASLADSVASLQQTVKLTEDSLATAYSTVDSMLSLFTFVDNPREVEGYTILKAARDHYPLTRTGLTARIAKSEAFELIAALSGGSFTSIAVSAGGKTVESATVGHDQGLNYRSGGLNTVLFTGAKADSIGRLVAASAPDAITVSYIGSTRRTIKMQPADAMIVTLTWKLAEARAEVSRLERTLPLLSRKIDLLRSKTEK